MHEGITQRLAGTGVRAGLEQRLRGRRAGAQSNDARFGGRPAPLTDRLTIPLTAHAIRRGATRASSYLFVVPAVTVFAAWPLLGTPVGPLTVAGLVVVGVALLLTSGRFGVRRDAVVASHRSADRPAAAVPG